MKNLQLMFTPAMGKKLIAMAILKHPSVNDAYENHRLVLACGTTTSYIAEVLLEQLGQTEGFYPQGFYKGIVRPYGVKGSQKELINDVIIEKGVWRKDLKALEIGSELAKGDMILKGANAINLKSRESAVLVGNPGGGTVTWIIPAVIGKRCGLMVPAGVEKRLDESLCQIALEVNSAESTGLRMCLLPGELFTEIEAFKLLFGVDAKMISAGGVHGAEGCVYFSCRGEEEALKALQACYDELKQTPPFIS